MFRQVFTLLTQENQKLHKTINEHLHFGFMCYTKLHTYNELVASKIWLITQKLPIKMPTHCVFLQFSFFSLDSKCNKHVLYLTTDGYFCLHLLIRPPAGRVSDLYVNVMPKEALNWLSEENVVA